MQITIENRQTTETTYSECRQQAPKSSENIFNAINIKNESDVLFKQFVLGRINVLHAEALKHREFHRLGSGVKLLLVNQP